MNSYLLIYSTLPIPYSHKLINRESGLTDKPRILLHAYEGLRNACRTLQQSGAFGLLVLKKKMEEDGRKVLKDAHSKHPGTKMCTLKNQESFSCTNGSVVF